MLSDTSSRAGVLVALAVVACAPATTTTPSGTPPSDPSVVVFEPDEALPPGAEWPPECVAVPTGHAAFGTTADEELRDVAITKTGAILAVGYDRATSSPGPLGTRGIVLELSRDLVGISQIGVLDSAGTDAVESIAIAPDTGRVWAVGRSDAELPGMPGYGAVDWIIGELTSTGGFERLARGLESAPEYPRRLAVGSAGRVVIAGDEQVAIPGGGTSVDPFLATYDIEDGSGAPIWFVSRRGTANESYRAVDLSDAQVVVGGDISDGDDQGMYVTAFDRDGARLWRRQLSQQDSDTVAAVAILPDGNVLWAGSGGGVVVGSLDGATGEPLWAVQNGSADADVTDFAVDDQGRIAIVGTTQAFARTDVDAFLLVLDGMGHELLTEQWASDGDDRPTAVAMDTCGGIALVGATNGDLVDVGQGGKDAFVLVTHVVDRVPRSASSRHVHEPHSHRSARL